MYTEERASRWQRRFAEREKDIDSNNNNTVVPHAEALSISGFGCSGYCGGGTLCLFLVKLERPIESNLTERVRTVSSADLRQEVSRSGMPCWSGSIPFDSDKQL